MMMIFKMSTVEQAIAENLGFWTLNSWRADSDTKKKDNFSMRRTTVPQFSFTLVKFKKINGYGDGEW
jgi:hypothetical protein